MLERKSNNLEKRGEVYFIRNPGTGEWLELKGYGSQKIPLNLDPRIDLLKPIYEQVLRLQEADCSSSRRKKSSARKVSTPA